MMLSNKYKLPQSTVDQMITDGVIPAQWKTYEDVYEQYLNLKSTGITKTEIYLRIGEKTKMSEETVKKIILKLGKI